MQSMRRENRRGKPPCLPFFNKTHVKTRAIAFTIRAATGGCPYTLSTQRETSWKLVLHKQSGFETRLKR